MVFVDSYQTGNDYSQRDDLDGLPAQWDQLPDAELTIKMRGVAGDERLQVVGSDAQGRHIVYTTNMASYERVSSLFQRDAFKDYTTSQALKGSKAILPTTKYESFSHNPEENDLTASLLPSTTYDEEQGIPLERMESPAPKSTVRRCFGDCCSIQ